MYGSCSRAVYNQEWVIMACTLYEYKNTPSENNSSYYVQTFCMQAAPPKLCALTTYLYISSNDQKINTATMDIAFLKSHFKSLLF